MDIHLNLKPATPATLPLNLHILRTRDLISLTSSPRLTSSPSTHIITRFHTEYAKGAYLTYFSLRYISEYSVHSQDRGCAMAILRLAFHPLRLRLFEYLNIYGHRTIIWRVGLWKPCMAVLLVNSSPFFPLASFEPSRNERDDLHRRSIVEHSSIVAAPRPPSYAYWNIRGLIGSVQCQRTWCCFFICLLYICCSEIAAQPMYVVQPFFFFPCAACVFF